MGNMRKHAVICWGQEAIDCAMQMGDQEKARKVVVKSILETGRIVNFFVRKDKNTVTYSHMQHTREEAR